MAEALQHAYVLQADRLAYLGVALQCSSKDLAPTSQQQDPSTLTNRQDIQPHGCSVSPDGQPGPSNGQLEHLDWQPRPHHAQQPVTATCAAHVNAPAAAAAQGLSDRLKIVLSGCMRQQCQEIQVSRILVTDFCTSLFAHFCTSLFAHLP